MIVESSQVIEYSPMKISQEEKMCLIGLYGHQNHLELLNEGDDRDCIIAYWNEQLMNDMQLLSVAFVKLFSSSAATGLTLDIFKEYGTDSLQGLCASIMLSCTESVFYTMSVYFMSVKIRRTRWTLPCALLATLAGIIMSIILAYAMI